MKTNEIKLNNEILILKSILKDTDQKIAELEKKLHHKDCQIEKWKTDYENCSRLEKTISKERQYCLDNWRNCEKQLAEQPKQIVMKIRKELCIHLYRPFGADEQVIDYSDFITVLDNLLKEYSNES